MHLCLSCNQPCNISAIFCESCRLSLLERSVEEQAELPPPAEMSEAHGGGEGLVDLAALPQMEAQENMPLRQTEGVRLRFWSGAGGHGVETLEEERVAEDVAVPDSSRPTNVLPVAAPPARRPMPRRIRRALLVFCVVGVLAFTVDGVLLALSIMRHHGAARGIVTTAASHPSTSTPGAAATATMETAQTVFSLSSTRLLFTAVQGQTDPAPQTLTLLSGGKKAFSWNVVPVSTFPLWLHLSATQGKATATGVQVIVSTQAGQLTPGTYAANLLVRAFDGQGKALSESPQTLAVVLVVQVPCSLSVTPKKISFASVLLSPPSPQTLSLTETGDCARPVSWQASADVPWVTFVRSSGTDTGAGSILTIQASTSGKLIGTYTAHITLMATDAHGMPLAGSPVTITATLTVLA